jgi:hypothetical protein
MQLQLGVLAERIAATAAASSASSPPQPVPTCQLPLQLQHACKRRSAVTSLVGTSKWQAALPLRKVRRRAHGHVARAALGLPAAVRWVVVLVAHRAVRALVVVGLLLAGVVDDA